AGHGHLHPPRATAGDSRAADPTRQAVSPGAPAGSPADAIRIRSRQVERPRLADEVVAEAVVGILVHQHEPGGLVDAPSRDQDVVGPQNDPEIARPPGEAEALVHEAGADPLPARRGLD